MTGIKMARIRKCQKCEHRSTRHTSIDDWPRCDAGGFRELDNAFMEGPDGNCPLGYWAGLKPVDLEAEAEAVRIKSIEKETARWKNIIDILSPTETLATEIQSKIEQLVTEHIIKYPETAVALEGHVEARPSQIEP